MKIEWKGNTPYTEGVINQHIPLGFCFFSKFCNVDVLDPLKVYRSKDCVKKFIGHIKPETKMLYETAHTQSSPWFHLSRQYIALHDKQGYFLW